jgi:hypothetical protein
MNSLTVKETSARLGFVYDRVREIPEEQVQKAFEEIEKQRKKSKPF